MKTVTFNRRYSALTGCCYYTVYQAGITAELADEVADAAIEVGAAVIAEEEEVKADGE